jgi:hypothetical protein
MAGPAAVRSLVAALLYVALVSVCVYLDGRLYTVSRCMDGRLPMQVGFTVVIVVHALSLAKPPSLASVVYVTAALCCTYISLSKYGAAHYTAVGVAAIGVLVDAARTRSVALPLLLGVAVTALAATFLAPGLVAPLEHVYFMATIVRVALDGQADEGESEPAAAELLDTKLDTKIGLSIIA